MATYDFTNIAIYQTDDSLVNTPAIGGTLDDSEADTTFEPGDTIGVVAGNTFTYVGTTLVNGEIYPVGEAQGDGGLAAGQPVIFADTDLTGLAADPLGVVVANNFTVCFAAGTEIATADGVALVEELKIGDMVRTLDGRDVAVKWVGRQSVSTKFGPAERLTPIKVAAGALGENTPSKDLIVTADHALLIGDTLCAAGALVNGTTIARTNDLGETFTVYHVETAEHEVILANGVAAETFIDNVARTAFDNFAEFDALYGDVAEMKELDYPRAMTARQVPAAIKAALAAEKVA